MGGPRDTANPGFTIPSISPAWQRREKLTREKAGLPSYDHPGLIVRRHGGLSWAAKAAPTRPQ